MHETKLTWQERQSESPFIESVWSCMTQTQTSRTVIADPCISLTLVKCNQGAQVILLGPKTKTYSMLLPAGYACTSIRLKPGASLKNIPTQKLLDKSFIFPTTPEAQFQLNGGWLQFPHFNNVEELIDQLHEKGDLLYTMPVLGQIAPRTYARQIRRATGLSPYQLFQLQRIHQVLRLLKQGSSPVEIAADLAFVDQSHLIRASKKFFGHTPKQFSNLPQLP